MLHLMSCFHGWQVHTRENTETKILKYRDTLRDTWTRRYIETETEEKRDTNETHRQRHGDRGSEIQRQI